jgi:hypothetical protein
MRTQKTSVAVIFAILGLVVLAPTSACSGKTTGGNNANGGDDDGGGSGSGSGGNSGSSSGGFGSSGGTFTQNPPDSGIPNTTCAAGSGFQCSQAQCSGGMTTTITGSVFDPAGQIPLYNVSVYVPNAPLVALPDGVSCGDCANWYTTPVVSTSTDTSGNFTLTNAPSGANIPLVVQVGKWRMEYMLPNVTQCVVNNAESLLGGKLHMPRNHIEGSIPNIAVSTGALDSLECLLERMGVDANEYTGDPMGAGRIHIFTGGDSPDMHGGAQTNSPVSEQSYQYLWDSDADIERYDIVLLSCEGNPTSYLNDAGRQVLMDYTSTGGRVFASHYHYSWFISGPFATVQGTIPPLATWTPEGTAGKTEAIGPQGDTVPYPGDVVTTTLKNGAMFPEGVALQKWLTAVGALTNNQLPIWYARHNADLSKVNTASQPWIELDKSTADPNAAEYFSFDTPVGSGAESCGRVVYSDLHVSGGIDAEANPAVVPDYPSGLAIVPDGCASHPLTPQEKALEFMIFDLSSCLTPVGMVPPPFPTK